MNSLMSAVNKAAAIEDGTTEMSEAAGFNDKVGRQRCLDGIREINTPGSPLFL